MVPSLLTTAVPWPGAVDITSEAASIDLSKSPALSFASMATVAEPACSRMAKSLLAAGLSTASGSRTVISKGVCGQFDVCVGPQTGI